MRLPSLTRRHGLAAALSLALLSTNIVHGQTATPQPPIVKLADIAAHIGQVVTVEDAATYTNTEAQSGMFYLNFGAFPNQVFSIAIPDQARSIVPADALRGGRVRVTGLVERDLRGKPQIVVRPGVTVTALAASLDAYTVKTPGAKPCCRQCSSGKACGDSCISKRAVCRAGPGCAC
jgi:hypothetical protein